MKMHYLNILITAVLFSFLSCTGNILKEELEIAKKDWNYVLSLPSDNDSLNLLFIRAEKCWDWFITGRMKMNCLSKILKHHFDMVIKLRQIIVV